MSTYDEERERNQAADRLHTLSLVTRVPSKWEAHDREHGQVWKWDPERPDGERWYLARREDETVMAIVKLPDGRYAARNRQNTSDLTMEDLGQMGDAVALWLRIHAMKALEVESEADLQAAIDAWVQKNEAEQVLEDAAPTDD